MDEKRRCYRCKARRVCRHWPTIRKEVLENLPLRDRAPHTTEALYDGTAELLANACAAWTPVQEEKHDDVS